MEKIILQFEFNYMKTSQEWHTLNITTFIVYMIMTADAAENILLNNRYKLIIIVYFEL